MLINQIYVYLASGLIQTPELVLHQHACEAPGLPLAMTLAEYAERGNGLPKLLTDFAFHLHRCM
jgi:hypothetical protein